MQREPLTARVHQHLGAALAASSGRSAHTIDEGHEHVQRQTLIALRAGTSLDEHDNPGEVTIQVLHGCVTLVAGAHRWTGSPGDLVFIPDHRHASSTGTPALSQDIMPHVMLADDLPYVRHPSPKTGIRTGAAISAGVPPDRCYGP